MTAPTLYGTSAGAGAGGSFSRDWPAGHTTGDIAILVIETWTAQVPPADPTGFTFIGTEDDGGSGLHAYWRRATSSSEAAVFTGDSGDHQAARMYVFRGCVASGSPIEGAVTGDKTVASTVATLLGVTTTGADRLWVGIASRPNDLVDDATFSNYVNSNLVNLAEAGEASTNQGTGGGFTVATGIKEAAGATGNTTADQTVSTTNCYISFALIPAAAGSIHQVREIAAYTTGTSGNPHVITVAQDQDTGTHLVLTAQMAGGRTLTGVTDSQGNTWQVDATLLNTTSHGIGIASCKPTTPLDAGDTITMTWSGTGVASAVVNEYAGLHASAWFDKTASAASVSSTAVDSGSTATTTQADELLVGGAAHAGTPFLAPEVLSPPWNPRGGGSSTGTIRTVRSYDRVVASTAAYKFAGTLASAQVNTAAIVTYIGAGGTITLTPDPVVITLTPTAPTMARSLTLAPSPVVVTLTPTAPTLSRTYVLAPDPVVVTLTPTAPTISLGTLALTPSPVVVTLTPTSPTLALSLTLTPDPVVVTLVLPAPTISVSGGTQTLTPDPVVVTLVPTAPSLVFGAITIAPDPVVVTLTPTAPTVSLSYALAPDPVVVSLALPAPSLSLTYRLTPDPVAVTMTLPAPTLALSLTLRPDPVVVTLTLTEPTITGAVAAVPLPRNARATITVPGRPSATITVPGPSAGIAVPDRPTATVEV